MGKLRNFVLSSLVRLDGRQRPNPYVWVFSSTDNRHFNYNSKYLFEYVREHYPQIRPMFVINDPKLRRELCKRYGARYFVEIESMRGIRKVLNAGVWFTSAGMPVYGWDLKKGRRIVNLWHGVPLKKIALLDPNLGSLNRLYFRALFTANYTHILTTSDHLIPVMSESFAVPEDLIKVWGQPRNDRIFEPKDRDAILSGFYRDLPEYRRVILYAPTFRDGGRTQLFPFPDYSREEFEAFLEKEKILLCLRTHIKEKESANLYLSSRIRFLGNEEAEDVTGILDIFDLLVTDYSSIYIDYLLTGQPEIFLPYDKEEYLADRGMNFDYDTYTPGPKPSTMKQFFLEVQSFFAGEDSWKQSRIECNEFFNSVQEPCSERICQEMFQELHLDLDGRPQGFGANRREKA